MKTAIKKTMLAFAVIAALMAHLAALPLYGEEISSAMPIAAGSNAQFYSIGKPVLKDIWVDPVKGKDTNSGASKGKALRTLNAAWNRIPQGVTFKKTGYRIMLAPGSYASKTLPIYMESRYGTFKYPIIIQAADSSRPPTIHGYLNIYNTKYLYLIGLKLVTDRGYGGGGNVLHFEKCDHILIRNCSLDGFDGKVNQPQETIKANQTQYIYVEKSDISGAYWFALDYMAVQYGHIRQCRVHNAGEDGLLIKGGSANIIVEGNEIYDARTIGFSAGQGSGLEYLTPPWIHYDAYDIKFINNVIHDVRNAGMAVRGGYNILLAYNTLYNIGTDKERGAALLLLSPGGRGCDSAEHEATCQELHEMGGWGSPVPGEVTECIPNRNVYVYNNIFYNPSSRHTMYTHFDIFGPRDAPEGSNIPSPVESDTNLRIWGNLIYNGPKGFPLGAGDEGAGCQSTNPTCNSAQLLESNTINSFEPKLKNPGKEDFHPVKGGNVYKSDAYKIPSFPGNDRPKPPLPPQGVLKNTVAKDKDNRARTSPSPPGAFVK